MIGVNEALERIIKSVARMPNAEVRLKDALGGVLGENVLAPVTFPPFDQSAMDGYAVRGIHSSDFSLVGEVKAGDDSSSVMLKEGEAVRIFTGAMVPSSAEAVVKQEEVEVLGSDKIRIEKQIRLSENVRKEGEQISLGQTVARKGARVNTGLVAYCAMLGIESLKIYKKPNIGLITTGSELVQPGELLKPGQIYDSNSIMLETALLELGYPLNVMRTKDDLNSTKEVVKQALENFDIVLLTGGISVGDYDFVHEALSSNGVKEVFYKVKQKPGKPLYMGMKDSKVVFGLPGNPASVYTCFQVYVLEALRLMLGIEPNCSKQEFALLEGELNKSAGRAQFLKAKEVDGQVEVLARQSSAMLGDFIDANCFVVFDESQETIKDESVQIIRLPKQFLF